MIKIEKEDLSNLELLGKGKYGAVYKALDNVAYKIYHPYVLGLDGYYIKNPCLSFSKRKYNLLKKRSKKIQYTDFFEDIIFLDGKFGGVQLPYYSGDTLDKYINADFDTKCDLSRQLIRNSNELYEHYIYPLDYKLNNIMVDNKSIKIIDLDDVCTNVYYFSSSVDKNLSLFSLNDSILSLFNEKRLIYRDLFIRCNIKRKIWSSQMNYDNLEEFFKYKSIHRKFLIINSHTNFDCLKEVLKHDSFDLLFECPQEIDDYSFYHNVINSLKKKDILIYDFISNDECDNYFCCFPKQDTYELHNKVLVKK